MDRGLPLPRYLMSVVHRHYFAPEYEEFKHRTLWSLTNAFTSAFKLLKPVQQFQATAKLGGFLARRDFNAADTGALVAAAREAIALGA